MSFLGWWWLRNANHQRGSDGPRAGGVVKLPGDFVTLESFHVGKVLRLVADAHSYHAQLDAHRIILCFIGFLGHRVECGLECHETQLAKCANDERVYRYVEFHSLFPDLNQPVIRWVQSKKRFDRRDNGEGRPCVRSCVAAYLGMTNAPRTRFSTCRHLTRGVTLSPCNTPSSPCVEGIMYGSGLGVL